MSQERTNQNGSETSVKFGSHTEMRTHSNKHRPSEQTIGLSPEQFAQAMLSAAFSAQSRMAAVLAHDLNSPMGALQSALKSIALILAHREARPTEGSKLHELFCALEQVAQEAGQRLRQTLDQIRRFTNLEHTRPEVDDMNQDLRDVLEFLPPEPRQRLRVLLDIEPLQDLKFKSQVNEGFQNLLRTLIDYSVGNDARNHRSCESDELSAIETSNSSRHPATSAGSRVAKTQNEISGVGEPLGSEQPAVGGISANRRSPCLNKAQEANFMNCLSAGSESFNLPRRTNDLPDFGISVEVIDRVPIVSLVRYQNREFIVETPDLKKRPQWERLPRNPDQPTNSPVSTKN